MWWIILLVVIVIVVVVVVADTAWRRTARWMLVACETATLFLIVSLPGMILLKVIQIRFESHHRSYIVDSTQWSLQIGHGVMRRVDDFLFLLQIGMAATAVGILHAVRSVEFHGNSERDKPWPLGSFLTSFFACAIFLTVFYVNEVKHSGGTFFWNQQSRWVVGTAKQHLQHERDELTARGRRLNAELEDYSLNPAEVETELREIQESARNVDALLGRLREFQKADIGALTVLKQHEALPNPKSGMHQVHEAVSSLAPTRLAHFVCPAAHAQWGIDLRNIRCLQLVEGFWNIVMFVAYAVILAAAWLCRRTVAEEVERSVPNREWVTRTSGELINGLLAPVRVFIYVLVVATASLGLLSAMEMLDPLRDWFRGALHDISGFLQFDTIRGGRIFVGRMCVYLFPAAVIVFWSMTSWGRSLRWSIELSPRKSFLALLPQWIRQSGTT